MNTETFMFMPSGMVVVIFIGITMGMYMAKKDVPEGEVDYIHICNLREFIDFLTDIADRAEQTEGFEGYERAIKMKF